MPKSSEELFADALALRDPAERAALLDSECAGNSELRAEVESLLAAHEQAVPFFNQPTIALDVSLEKPRDKIGHSAKRRLSRTWRVPSFLDPNR